MAGDKEALQFPAGAVQRLGLRQEEHAGCRGIRFCEVVPFCNFPGYIASLLKGQIQIDLTFHAAESWDLLFGGR
jgi:hypothetical protein